VSKVMSSNVQPDRVVAIDRVIEVVPTCYSRESAQSKAACISLGFINRFIAMV